MSPKEKATELFDKMMQTISDNCEHSSYCSRKECTWKGITVCLVTRNEAKQCALIAVDEILNQYGDGKFNYKILDEEESIYWKAVRAEIEGL